MMIRTCPKSDVPCLNAAFKNHPKDFKFYICSFCASEATSLISA